MKTLVAGEVNKVEAAEAEAKEVQLEDGVR